jgi:hypothetical protein
MRSRCVQCEARRRWRSLLAPLLAVLSVLAVARLGLGSEASAAGEPGALAAQGSPPDPVVLRADGAGILLEWHAPSFGEYWVLGADGLPYLQFDAPGWALADEPGRPQLPFATALLVAPPEADLSLHVVVLESEERELAYPVVPAGQVAAGGRTAWAFDPSVYETGFAYPSAVVSMEEAGWMRGHRLVRLAYYPLRFDPQGPSLDVALAVRVEVGFEGSAAKTTGVDAGADPVLAYLEKAVVNPAGVGAFARFDGASHTDAGVKGVLGAITAPSDTEYLIVTHPDFVSAVQPLATRRETADGLTVYITTTDAIYDAYPTLSISSAIRTYISATYHSVTTPSLSYVLLVGDGAEDPAATQYVPPYLVPDPWAEEQGGAYPYGTAADNRYGETTGDAGRLAEIYVGRLPVRTAAEATTVVGKILDYEADPPQWPWNERLLFFAGDEEYDEFGTPVPAGQFHDQSDAVYSSVPVTYTGRRVYFCTAGCAEPHLYTSIRTARSRTIGALNEGALLASYLGHSSWHQWAVDPVELPPNWMFHLDDVSSLSNGGALPVVLNMTCYTGRFAHSSDDTLDESMVRHPGGGAIATWGNTTLGSSAAQSWLHELFYEAVFEEGITELGPALEFAKASLPGGYEDLRDTFVLLGDPALDLNMTIVPWASDTYLPLVLRSY